MVTAHVNPAYANAYAMNEAYTSNERDNQMDSAKIAIGQDIKLTENIY